MTHAHRARKKAADVRIAIHRDREKCLCRRDFFNSISMHVQREKQACETRNVVNDAVCGL